MRSDLGERTKQFALRIVRFYIALPKTTEMQVLGKQMLRAGTSVGAHYREASRSRSDAEFISKVEGGLQELVETGYWIELLWDLQVGDDATISDLLDEVRQLDAILTTCVRKVKEKQRAQKLRK